MQFMWECCENLIMLDLDQLASHEVITVLQLYADFQSDDKKLPRDNYYNNYGIRIRKLHSLG